MRREDREVTDAGKIAHIIEMCDCCRIGFVDEGQVYIVPLSFGYIQEKGRYIFYFHGAKEGKKLDLIRENPNVGFEMDTAFQLKRADVACKHSAYFKSIIGHGKISIVEEQQEKRVGLGAIMRHNTGREEWEFPERMVDAVCVFKVVVDEMTGKEHAEGV